MKASELVEGVEYALGGVGRYDTFRRSRCRYLGRGGGFDGSGGRIFLKDGHRFELLTDSLSYPLSVNFDVGDVFALRDARYVREPWADFEPRLQAYREGELAKVTEASRVAEVMRLVKPELKKRGVHSYGAGRYPVALSADDAAKLLGIEVPVELQRKAIADDNPEED